MGTTGIWAGREVPSTGLGLGNFGNTVRDLVETALIDNNHPGATVAITYGGRLVYSGAFGYSNWEAGTLMQNYMRCQMGSTTKVLTTLAMMKLVHDRADVGLQSRVYGSSGILSDASYTQSFERGTRRHYPLVGLALGRDNHVLAYYSDEVYTEGTSEDLDAYAGPVAFTLPAGRQMHELIDVARGGSQNRVYSWYSDGSYAVGTPSNLAQYQYVTGTDFLEDRRDQIVGIAVDTREDVFYAYQHDGVVTSGDSPGNLENRWTKNFSVPADWQRRYDIIGVARSDNDVMTVWYSDEQASKGHSTDLGANAGLYAYARRGVTGSRDQWHDAYEAMEIRHLLSHTSGFTKSGEAAQAAEMFGLNPDLENNPFPYEFSNFYMLSTRPLLFKPGQADSYSNHGMGLVGHLIEELTGQTWYDYLRSNILVPAQATEIYPSRFDIDTFVDARPHTLSNGVIRTLPYESPATDPGSAAGTLKASAVDLARVLVATDRLSNHPDVLRDSVLDIMETRPFPNEAQVRALGWRVDCKNASCSSVRYRHDGVVNPGGGSFIAKYSNYPTSGTTVDGVTVAILVNRDSDSGLDALTDAVAAAVSSGTVDPSDDLFNPIMQ